MCCVFRLGRAVEEKKEEQEQEQEPVPPPPIPTTTTAIATAINIYDVYYDIIIYG